LDARQNSAAVLDLPDAFSKCMYYTIVKKNAEAAQVRFIAQLTDSARV